MMDSLPNTSRATESNMLLGALISQESPSLNNSGHTTASYLELMQQAISKSGFPSSSSVVDTSRSADFGSFPSNNTLAETNAKLMANFGFSFPGSYNLSHLSRQDQNSMLFSSIGGTRNSSHDGKRSSSSHKSSSKSNRSPSRSNHHAASSQIVDNGSSSSSNAAGSSNASISGLGCSNNLILPTAVVSHSRTSSSSHSSRSATSVTSSASKSSSSAVINSLPVSAASSTANAFPSYLSSGNFDMNSLQNIQQTAAALFPPYYNNYSELYNTLTASNYKKLYSSSLDTAGLNEILALQNLLSRKPTASSTSVEQPFKVASPKVKSSGTANSSKDLHESTHAAIQSTSIIPAAPPVTISSVFSSGATTIGSFSDKSKQSTNSTVNLKNTEKMHHFSNKDLIADAVVSYAREMLSQDVTKDIVLTCEDKVSVRIHSGIMMAYCSSYIEMFEISKYDGQCVILLTDTKSKDVSDLVNALYTGKLPSDCSLTGVNYVAQLLGLKSFVSLLQRSLKDEVNQSFLRRHNTETWTKSGRGSQSPITLPLAESTSKSYKLPETVGSVQDNPTRSLGPSDSSDKRGTKRKSDAFASKFSEQSQYRAKEPKLDGSFVSDASPLNLSKSSSSPTTTNVGDSISPTTVPSVTGSIDTSQDHNAAVLNQLFNKYQSEFSAMNFLNPASGAAMQQYSDTQLAFFASQVYNATNGDKGSTTPSRSKNSSKAGTTKASKQLSSSSIPSVAAAPAAEAVDDMQKLKELQAWIANNPNEYLARLCQGEDTTANANYLAVLQTLTPYALAAANNQGGQEVDLDPYRDSTGALNLSADGRDDSKTKKDSAKMDSPETASASSIQNSWVSSIAASSTPSLTAASYSASDAASTIAAAAGSYGPYTGFDFKPNGLIAGSSHNTGIGITDFSKLLKNSGALKTMKPTGVDGDVGVLPTEAMAGSEDGMDDIIEVLADEDGSLLASYAGGQRRFLYHAGHGRRRKGCGKCENCLRSDDCGSCRYCADKAKFGGQNKLKQVCEKKRCLNDVQQKSKTRCQTCKPCLLTEDCDECEKCIINKGQPPNAKKLMCESRLCEYLEMEDLRARNFTQEPSPYSTDSVMTEAQAAVIAAAAVAVTGGGASNCPSPDDYTYFHGDKKSRKMLKKKPKDGKGSSPKVSRARTKYQCNTCWGCITTSPCQFCVYCRDMPKHGGTGKYRQKCVKQLCILHPRLQSNKINVIDTDAPLQCELEIALDPYKDNFDAASVTKVAMVNFLRLHHRQEGGDRTLQTAKMLDILARKKQIVAESSGGNDMEFKEERGETPDNPEYSSEPCRASGSTTASTPEPSDGGLTAAFQSRHLPDLRPILGHTAATMSSAELAAYNAALTNVLAASTSEYASAVLSQQMLMQHHSSLATAAAPSTSTSTASAVPTTKIDTVTIADNVRSEADVDVEQVESVAVENDAIVATDLSSPKKNTELEAPSSADAEVLPASSSSPAIVTVVSDPEITADEIKTINEEQPAVLPTPALPTPLPQEEEEEDDDKESVVEVLDAPADEDKEEAMEFTEEEDKSNKQTSPRRNRVARGKRSSENRGRTFRSRSQRRSPSPSPAGPVRTRAQSRELPPRRARAKANSYVADPFDHLDHSESDEVLEEVVLATEQPVLVENGALVKGSSEDDDSESTAIQAAVDGVINRELAESRITEDSKRTTEHTEDDAAVDETDEGERWDIKTTDPETPVGNDANGNKTDASSAQTAKLYMLEPQQDEVQPMDVSERMLHQRDPASGTEFGAGTVAPPPVPKLKLRLSNGPTRSVEKVPSFDSNGINS